MRACVIILSTAVLLWADVGLNTNPSWNRVCISVTLSGHILAGIGLEHGFNGQQSVHVDVYPVVVPGGGLPFAVSGGYNYYFLDGDWQPLLGLDFTVMFSPPDPKERKSLLMLNLRPGMRYQAGNRHSLAAELWLARFLNNKNKRWPLMPIGLRTSYGFTP